MFSDELVCVSDATIPRALTSNFIEEAWVGVDKGSFDFERGLVVTDAVPMDDGYDSETCGVDVVYALLLQVVDLGLVVVFGAIDMGEDTVVSALTDVKSLTIPWVDEPVDV